MIDIHSHVLPGLDDGAKDIEEALAMCAMAEADGIKAMVASPHYMRGPHTNTRQAILDSLSALQSALKERSIGIKLMPGADVDLLGPTVEKSQDIMTVNDTGRYMLVEPSLFMPRDQIKVLLFRLRLKGIVPVITHPERLDNIGRDFQSLADMIASGCLLQVTSGSLTGAFGLRAQETAYMLLERNMVHAVATDAHDLKARAPLMSEALHICQRRLGAEAASRLFYETPSAIVEGRHVEPEEPVMKPKRKGPLGRLLEWVQRRHEG